MFDPIEWDCPRSFHPLQLLMGIYQVTYSNMLFIHITCRQTMFSYLIHVKHNSRNYIILNKMINICGSFFWQFLSLALLGDPGPPKGVSGYWMDWGWLTTTLLGIMWTNLCTKQMNSTKHTHTNIYIGQANNERTTNTHCKVSNDDYKCLKEDYISFD